MRRVVLAMVALLATAFFGATARGTVAVPLSLRALIGEATVIVRGRVLDRVSSWDGPRIVTDTRLQVAKVLRGKVTDPEVMIRQWGGTVGKLTMAVRGNARFKAGEDVVVFLITEGQHHYVLNMAQGKFSIERQADSRYRLTRDLGGIKFAQWDAQGRMQLAPRWSFKQPLYLDALEAQIKLVTAQGVVR